MAANLNIPLTQPSTTRRRSWRVVWMVLIQLGLLAATWLVGAYLLRAHTHTLSLAPEKTDSSLLIVKNGQSIASIHENIGHKSLFPGAPWTVQDAMDWSKREFSLHFAQGELVGVTTDQAFDSNTLMLAQYHGFSQSNDGKSYSLSTEPSHSRTVSRFTPALLTPRTNGIFLENGRKYSARINHVGITVKGIGQDSPIFPAWSLTQDAEVLSRWYIPPGSSAFSDSLANIIQTHGAHTLFARDSLGLAQYITISLSDIPTEDLAEIATDLISRNALTTTALTTTDGSIFEEIRVDTQIIETNIESQDGLTTITSRVGDESIRITRSANLVTISNRDLSSGGSASHLSTCLPGAENFSRTSELSAALNTSSSFAPQTVPYTVFNHWFTEIAASSRVLRLCW